MAKIPFSLIIARLLMGIVILLLAIWHVPAYPVVAAVLLTAGLLSDIFDGIIARRLHVSSPLLRRLDSSVDQVFFILVIISIYLQYPAFFQQHKWQLIVLMGTEALTYVVSFLKFRKEIATHAIASKIWTLLLFASLVEIMLTGNSGLLFQLCFYIGMLTRLEIIAIIFVLRQWTNDVPSLYHAILLRQGKPIKRSKLFNG